jgi:hypothetical protein
MKHYLSTQKISDGVICFLAGALMAADVISTHTILLNNGIEVNPIADQLLVAYGFAGLILEKIFFLSILLVGFLLQVRTYGRTNQWFTIPTSLTVLVYALLVMYEVCLINNCLPEWVVECVLPYFL